MRYVFLFIGALSLASCADAYRAPSFSSDPSGMSSQTLCYRYATGKKTDAMKDEIELRNLDCETILVNDPLYRAQSY